MRRVSIREANQNFSSCIADVEAGEHLIVERRGVPVAEIIPFREPAKDKKRAKELEAYFKLLEQGLPLGGGKAPSKDEMHER
jgi:prevent-host-death family protein